MGRSDYAYAFMRIVAGLMFCCHGAQKLFGVLGGSKIYFHPLSHLMLAAGIIEFCGGLLIAAGLLTSIAAMTACVEMAGAYYMVHYHLGLKIGLPQGYFPIVNKGELAVLYFLVWLYIASRGPGIWSLDVRIRR